MDWKRESEFRRLLSAQIKHLTKEGLETLAHIATTDMAESYKAVPALAVHKAKRVEKSGPGRLHILRILDAVIAKSRQRHASKDKFVPRIEASKVAQTIFAAISECPQTQKVKAAKILQVWRKNNIFAPPTLAAAEDALGSDAVLAEATSAAAAAPGPAAVAESSAPISRPDTGSASLPAPQDTTANGTSVPPLPAASHGLSASQLLPPVDGSARTDAERQAGGAGQGSTRAGAPTDKGMPAFPPGLPAASLPGPPARTPLYAPSSIAAKRAVQPRVSAEAAAALAAAPGAPPLPAEGVAPFQAGVDAVVLPSGATLNNPSGGRSKHRRSKFDQPAVPRATGGSGLGSNGSVETLARIGSGSAAVDTAPAPPGAALRASAPGSSSGPLPPPPASGAARPRSPASGPRTGTLPAAPSASSGHGTQHAPAAVSAAMAGKAYDPVTSPSDPALASRIRSSIANLRSDLGSKRDSPASQSPMVMPADLPLPPQTAAAPAPLSPWEHPPSQPSPAGGRPARASVLEPLPLPPVPTSASVPGIPGLLPKPHAAAPAPALPPPPSMAAAPELPAAAHVRTPIGELAAAAARTSHPPWAPALTEPAPPGLLDPMSPVPSLTGPPSIEVKPPPSFGEVWIPSADAVLPATSVPAAPPRQDKPPPLAGAAAAGPPPAGDAEPRTPWGSHAWGACDQRVGGASGAASVPDVSGARPQLPHAHAMPPSQTQPASHHQPNYNHSSGVAGSQWGQAPHDLHAGHAPQPPFQPGPPPQLRPPPSAPPPRHRFSAPPLGLPFPARMPGVPPGAPPQPPTHGPHFSRPFPPTHKPPSTSPAYNPYAAPSNPGPLLPHHGGPRPPSSGQPPPLAQPPPPRDSQGAWSPRDAPAPAAMPPPPPPGPQSAPRTPSQPYDPAAAATEGHRRPPPPQALDDGHLRPARPEDGPGRSGFPQPPAPSPQGNTTPAPPGGAAVNGSTAPASVAQPDAPSASGGSPAAGDGTEDGPARKRRRSRWDERSDEPEAVKQ